MRVLFLSNQPATGSAYAHRLGKLRQTLTENHHVETEFINLRDYPFSRPILAHPLNAPWLRDKVKTFDFIHAGEEATYAALALRRYTSARIIHDVHGDVVAEARLDQETRSDLRSGFKLLQAQITSRAGYRNADHWLVVSRPMIGILENEEGIDTRRIGLIRNGVDIDLFKPGPSTDQEGFEICYAGGFDTYQGVDMLIDAFEQIDKPGIRLKVIGFTDNHAELKQSIKTRLGEKVTLIDRVGQAELIDHLHAARVLIIPRPHHRAVALAFPTKFGEYTALGKAVIVTDVDETADLVHEYDCGFVSTPDVEGLLKTISEASNAQQDRLEAMGNNARGLAEKEFAWNEIGRHYISCLERWSASA